MPTSACNKPPLSSGSVKETICIVSAKIFGFRPGKPLTMAVTKMLAIGRKTKNVAVQMNEETKTSCAAFLSALTRARIVSEIVKMGTKTKKNPSFPFSGVISMMIPDAISDRRTRLRDGRRCQGVFTQGFVGAIVVVVTDIDQRPFFTVARTMEFAIMLTKRVSKKRTNPAARSAFTSYSPASPQRRTMCEATFPPAPKRMSQFVW